MTPKQKRESVTLLREAKKYQKVAVSKFYGICSSLEAAACELRLAPEPVRNLIKERLSPCIYLQLWLVDHSHVESYDVFKTPEGFAKLQRTRLAWIDALIEELSE